MRPATSLPHDPLELGESPRWDAANERLLLVDILGGVVLWGDLDGAPLAQVRVDGHVGCVAPIAGEVDVVLVGLDDGVARLHLPSGDLDWVARPEQARRGAVRMNDGACDPQGRLVVGSMAYDMAEGAGRLHRVAPDGAAEVVLEGCTVPNGLVWSGDGATLYHVDSGPKTVTAYAYGDGPLHEGTVVYAHDGPGVPDGMCAGPDGTLWIAFHGGAMVRRITTEGEVVEEHAVEARQPAGVWLAAGGRLVVGTGSHELEDPGPADGRTLVLDVGGDAVPAPPFGRGA